MGSLVSEENRCFRLRHGVLALLLGSAAALATPLTFAATPEETAAARSMAEQGLQAFNEERYQDAADLFERAESLVHSPIHLLYQARANVKVGQLVKAQEAYIRIIREKFRDDAPASFKSAQESARAEVEEIKPRLAKLTVKVSGVKQGAALTVDGDPVPAVLIGVPMPMDPGEHKLEVSAEGYAPKSATVKLTEGQVEAVELVLEPAAGGVPVAGAAEGEEPTAQGASGQSIGSDGGAPTSGGSNGMRIGSYVAFGVGAVGLGLGTVFLLDGASKADDADKKFAAFQRGEATEKEVSDLDAEADSSTNLGTTGLVVGGLGVATGVVLFLLSSDSGEQAMTPGVTPWVGLGSAGLSGRF